MLDQIDEALRVRDKLRPLAENSSDPLLRALAPEDAENLWLIEECVRCGISISAAHTEATFEQMLIAIERGLRQATHTFNAMTAFGHRQPGAVGAALALPQICAAN